MRTLIRFPLFFPLLVLALFVAGCAGLVPGQSTEKDVLAAWGPAVDQRTLPDGGKTLDYPKQPLGFENWRVTLDAKGTVQSVEQLIDEAHFARVRPGLSREEVAQVLGRHAETGIYPRSNELVWNWRFKDIGGQHMFFNAHFDASTEHLKYASRSMDPIFMFWIDRD